MSVRSAERRAELLIGEHEIYSLPVDVEKIAEELNINIQYVPFDGELSGILIRNEDEKEYVVGVNEKHPPVRKRFTIAHEIGHFLLHEGNETYIDTSIRYNFRSEESSQGNRIEEVEANAFAASLLMPEELIDEYIKKYDYFDYHDDVEIENMANAFQVSTQALMIRLARLRKFD